MQCIAIHREVFPLIEARTMARTIPLCRHFVESLAECFQPIVGDALRANPR